jgi:hypothetical protein
MRTLKAAIDAVVKRISVGAWMEGYKHQSLLLFVAARDLTSSIILGL